MQMNLKLFPALESPYSASKHPALPLSLLALHLQVIHAGGNSLHAERTKGHYFFRNESVPMPRAATFLAWDAICRVGSEKSPYFLLPFLPSLRADDEVGDAIQMRGAKVPSLSRKSSLHLRDDQKRIIWGSVYLARADKPFDSDRAIVYEYEKSNIQESKLRLRPGFYWPASQQTQIRHRMEFLASFGLPASNGYFSAIQIPPVTRLMFQFFKQQSAESWAQQYSTVKALTEADSGSIAADYKELLREIVESKRGNKEDDSEETPLELALKKHSKNRPKFGNIEDFDL